MKDFLKPIVLFLNFQDFPCFLEIPTINQRLLGMRKIYMNFYTYFFHPKKTLDFSIRGRHHKHLTLDLMFMAEQSFIVYGV